MDILDDLAALALDVIDKLLDSDHCQCNVLDGVSVLCQVLAKLNVAWLEWRLELKYDVVLSSNMRGNGP